MDSGRKTILVGLSGRRLFSPRVSLSLSRVSRAPYIFHTPATQASVKDTVVTLVSGLDPNIS